MITHWRVRGHFRRSSPPIELFGHSSALGSADIVKSGSRCNDFLPRGHVLSRGA